VPTLGSLAAGLQSVRNTRRTDVFITELDDDDQSLGGSTRRFQYYPDSISDSKAVNWAPKEVPGGSLPMYHYTGSGERNISFTAYFTTDIDHLLDGEGLVQNDIVALDRGWLPTSTAVPQSTTRRMSSLVDTLARVRERLRAASAEDRNPYVPGALLWLRRFMFPRYGENMDLGVPITRPPHKILLHFPGAGIELLGGSRGFSAPGGGVLCVMTQCDITIDALFPSGNIRVASVSLSFAEVPQRGGYVIFPDATGMDSYGQREATRREVGIGDMYWLRPRQDPASSGG
jgi:hypothetical protein